MLKKIKEILIRILYALILIYLIIFIPVFWGYKPLVVISGSMEPILKVGGILYYEDYNINSFKEGDILVYKTKKHIISHRIVKAKSNNFITKGDANKSNDRTQSSIYKSKKLKEQTFQYHILVIMETLFIIINIFYLHLQYL